MPSLWSFIPEHETPLAGRRSSRRSFCDSPSASTRARGDMTSTTTDGRLKLVLIIGGLSAFGPLSMDLYLPALPTLTRDLGGGASLVQLTLTACLLGLAAGQLVA